MSGDTDTARDRSDDELAVRNLYDELIAGWNQGSGARFGAAFAENGDLIAFDGTALNGRQQIEAFQQELFDKWVKGTRLTGEVAALRFLNQDTALVHAVGGTIKRKKTKPARARNSIQTLVATRTADGWRLAAFQNTRVRPIGASFFTFLHWSLGDALWSGFRLSTDPHASITPVIAPQEACHAHHTHLRRHPRRRPPIRQLARSRRHLRRRQPRSSPDSSDRPDP